MSLSCLLFVCPCLVATGIAFMTASLATTHWMRITFEEYIYFGRTTRWTYHAGLFQYCGKAACRPYDLEKDTHVSGELKAIQTLFIASLILYLLGLFIQLLWYWRQRTLPSLILGVASLLVCGLGAIAALTGLAVFIVTTEDRIYFLHIGVIDGKVIGPGRYYGYSFYLAWASVLPVILGAALAISAVTSDYKERENNGDGQGRGKLSQVNMAYWDSPEYEYMPLQGYDIPGPHQPLLQDGDPAEADEV